MIIMKVAVFSSKPYDEEYLLRANDGRHELEFHAVALSVRAVVLAEGCTAVCCFVNDCLNAQVLDLLAKMNISFIALRCAGFNNVDLIVAKQLGIKVARVPEYSPHAEVYYE